MNAKTMEGLTGASTNRNLLNTPMRVYKEARRRGDRATMERAMGYAAEFAEKAEEYKAEADKGMQEDAKAAKEEAKSEREALIRKRKEERKKLEERMEESKNADESADIVEISAEGKAYAQDSAEANDAGSEGMDTDAGAAKKPMAFYTKTGAAVSAEQAAGLSVSVSF